MVVMLFNSVDNDNIGRQQFLDDDDDDVVEPDRGWPRAEHVRTQRQ